MMFRQLFDQLSGTYSYLLASRPGGEALIIDPVLRSFTATTAAVVDANTGATSPPTVAARNRRVLLNWV
jgi:hypothetical protein